MNLVTANIIVKVGTSDGAARVTTQTNTLTISTVIKTNRTCREVSLYPTHVLQEM